MNVGASSHRRRALPVAMVIAPALVLGVLGLACGVIGGGGGASTKCVESRYHVPAMSDEDKNALMQSIAEMDSYARLRSIKAISRMASTDDCADFVEELDEWSGTPEGEEWYAESGEQIVPAVLNGLMGTGPCMESVPSYNDILVARVLDTGRTVARPDINLTTADRLLSISEMSISKMDDYRYEVTWNLLFPETYGGLLDLAFNCVLKAEVDNRRRTVNGIEAIQGTSLLNGQLLESY